MIQDELAKKVEQLNGENNSKLLKADKLPKEDYRHQFTSTTRTVLRNLWLFDFLHYFMDMIHDERDAKLSACAKNAYSKGLGIHHPWVVRQAAKLAMLATPSRETFLHDANASYEQIAEFKALLEQFRGPLWAFYKEKGLEELP